MRAQFIAEHNFQLRIYYNYGHIDYAYQLFTDVPLLRWDNKEEFAHLHTYPHHFHDQYGHVHPSSLTGDPITDIEVVLNELSTFLSNQFKE